MKTLSAVREYKAAPGAGFSDSDAAKFGTFLEEKVGLGTRPVSPEEIVQAARPRRSPLHGAFEWDDTVAAAEFRLWQARHLVGHIVVEVQLPDDGDTTVRAFHNVIVTDGETLQRGYVAEHLVWAKPEYAEQIVARALKELEAWTERYATYGELSKIVGRVSTLLDEDAG